MRMLSGQNISQPIRSISGIDSTLLISTFFVSVSMVFGQIVSLSFQKRALTSLILDSRLCVWALGSWGKDFFSVFSGVSEAAPVFWLSLMPLMVLVCLRCKFAWRFASDTLNFFLQITQVMISSLHSLMLDTQVGPCSVLTRPWPLEAVSVVTYPRAGELPSVGICCVGTVFYCNKLTVLFFAS